MTISRRGLLKSGAMLAGAAIAPFAPAGGPVAAPGSGRVDVERLQALLEQAVSSSATPGIALTVRRNGQEIFSRQAGLANLETGTQVTDASVFRVGSLTKQFAAAMILKLVAAGKLALADPARDYLPFLRRHEPFTILELLNHTAGVRDGDYDTGGFEASSQIAQAERIARQEPFFDFPPGTAWLYSNANYLLVGAVIERVSGKPLADAASTLLFQPLGLRDTAFDAPGDVVPGRASGYTPTGRPAAPFRNADYLDVALAGAAGAMRSTVPDLCRWQEALLSGKALLPALSRMMTLPGRLRNGQLSSTGRFSENDRPMGDTQYGLGLMLDNATRDGSLIAQHHGGINGFAAYLAAHPSSGLVYACLCNADTHPGLPLRDIRRTVFADLLPIRRT